MSVSSFDYDGFWQASWARANLTSVDVAADESRRAAVPRVFVYDRLRKPFSDWDPSKPTALNEAFGKPLRRIGNAQVSDTSGYAFGAMFHYRLWHSRTYRTTNPAAADLFFVPLLTAPKRAYAMNQSCRAVSREIDALEGALPHLTARTARRHVLVLSKEHVGAGLDNAYCAGWFFRPKGLLAHALRVSYSEIQSPALRSSAYWEDNDPLHPNRSNWEDPLNEYPNLFSVPFPSSIHAIVTEPPPPQQQQRALRELRHPPKQPLPPYSQLLSSPQSKLPPWDTSQPRKYAMSFIGTSNHGDVAVRLRLQAQCRQMGSKCVYAGFGMGKAMGLKMESDLCLEAAGDTPYRKSLADSIGSGCVPMLFHPMTDHANGWLWDSWKDAARVVVPRDDFITGRLKLARLAETMPPPLLALMKATISANARRFQISLSDDDCDSVHMILTGLAEAAAVAETLNARYYFAVNKAVSVAGRVEG